MPFEMSNEYSGLPFPSFRFIAEINQPLERERKSLISNWVFVLPQIESIRPDKWRALYRFSAKLLLVKRKARLVDNFYFFSVSHIISMCDA